MPTRISQGEPGQGASNGRACAFYRSVMSRLNDAAIPYLVGGAHALAYYTGILRDTKDFDIFVRRQDMMRTLAALASDLCHTELTYPHWLGKAICGDDFVDIIFSSGNAVANVDDEWFAHAPVTDVLGLSAKLAPAEEIIWSKAFVMERERFDGADVLHLILRRGIALDWPRILRRFGQHWRVLLAHLVMFRFVYPGERHSVPQWVMDQLVARLQHEVDQSATEGRLCRGPVLSRAQYLVDIESWGYVDARIGPQGPMTDSEVAQWTEAIGPRRDGTVGS